METKQYFKLRILDSDTGESIRDHFAQESVIYLNWIRGDSFKGFSTYSLLQ